MAVHTEMTGKSWALEMWSEPIEVTSQFPSANESWRFTDSQGHEHYYEHGYPTLDLIVDAEHWCDGDEGIAPHDPHMFVDESHYECKLCRETIKPKVDPPFTPKYIPGRVHAELRGMRSDGVYVDALSLGQDEMEAIEADMSDEVAQRLLDSADLNRCHWHITPG